jgi:hypothetical protein
MHDRVAGRGSGDGAWAGPLELGSRQQWRQRWLSRGLSCQRCRGDQKRGADDARQRGLAESNAGGGSDDRQGWERRSNVLRGRRSAARLREEQCRSAAVATDRGEGEAWGAGGGGGRRTKKKAASAWGKGNEDGDG